MFAIVITIIFIFPFFVRINHNRKLVNRRRRFYCDLIQQYAVYYNYAVYIQTLSGTRELLVA
jgi:hypothetical protein